jgi:ABC-type cobalamin/Fe3+-siderophores transport system ATPase subunit
MSRDFEEKNKPEFTVTCLVLFGLDTLQNLTIEPATGSERERARVRRCTEDTSPNVMVQDEYLRHLDAHSKIRVQMPRGKLKSGQDLFDR